MSFPKQFAWGVASAAYQIEGGANEGGRGASIWDTFSHTPGKTFGGDNGDIAADAFHRYAEDTALMAGLGIQHYRFSTSWARLDPTGAGGFNAEGFAYYDKVVDGCIAAGITPYLTLYHWDLPQALEDKGGWQNRETAVRFGQLAAEIGAHFAGRVKHYITLNEPQCSVILGYGNGEHAPGLQLSEQAQFHCWHNMMLAHGMAATALRAADSEALVGIATTGTLCFPQTETEANINAARELTFNKHDERWGFTHQMALDPVCFGAYPDYSGTPLQPWIEAVDPADMEVIHQKPDFIGLNIYNGHEVCVDENGTPKFTKKYAGFPRTALKWPVTPEVLNWGVRFVGERYDLPIYISENGLSCNDKVFLDGKVHDPDRIDFLHRYLRELKTAAENCDVRGYFQWCWTDNFEWHNGYKERFGLVFVDYPTGERTLKDSAHWYAEVARQNGENL